MKLFRTFFRCGLVVAIIGTFVFGAVAAPQVLTKDDGGKTIQLKVGDTFRLELAANPTTGFTWELDPAVVAAGMIKVKDSGYNPDAAAEGMVGVGGTAFWVIEAVKAGPCNLRLNYAQAWSDAAPADTFSAALAIAAADPVLIAPGTPPYVYVNGELLSGTPAPLLDNGRLYVPFRSLAKALDAEVSWDGTAKKVTAVRSGKTITLAIGELQATVDGKTVKTDAPAKIVNGYTYLPLRFVSSTFGAEVSWDGAAQKATITLK
jgi:predicted secreted protein